MQYWCYEADYLQDKSFIKRYSCLCPVVSAANLDIVSRMMVDPRGKITLPLSSETRTASSMPSDGDGGGVGVGGCSGHLVDCQTVGVY
jgi:hypothetical protein